MSHATTGAVAVVRTRSSYPFQDDPAGYRPMIAACNGVDIGGSNESSFFGTSDARYVMELSDYQPKFFVAWPTCPTCRVLLDAALEQRDVVTLMKEVANAD